MVGLAARARAILKWISQSSMKTALQSCAGVLDLRAVVFITVVRLSNLSLMSSVTRLTSVSSSYLLSLSEKFEMSKVLHQATMLQGENY